MMKLSEFVDETLTEIVTGIRAAQAREHGENVAAALPKQTDKGLLVSAGDLGHFTVVDFDVSVVAESTAGGKAGLRVWGIGAEGQGEHVSGHTSRVRFSVHLRIPEGDLSRLEKARDEEKARRAQRPTRPVTGSWMNR
jgi:hypothetical protein